MSAKPFDVAERIEIGADGGKLSLKFFGKDRNRSSDRASRDLLGTAPQSSRPTQYPDPVSDGGTSAREFFQNADERRVRETGPVERETSRCC